MGLKTAYIGLGSNLGDRVLALDAAVKRLKTVEDTRYIALSGLYETSPVGMKGGPFLNAVAVMETGLGPEVLLKGSTFFDTCQNAVITINKLFNHCRRGNAKHNNVAGCSKFFS